MKIFRLFTIAAAALILSACSSEDTAQNNNPVAGRQMHFTATIAAPNSGAGTRTEYTEDTENKKITVAWKVDDEIALVHDKVMDVVKVKTVNADGSATIDGTITSATDEATVQLVYPAARVSAVNSDGNPEFYEAVSGKLLTQDGTLTYIQNNIDFREGEGQLSVNGTEVTLNAAVDMVSSIAIWKLTLQDNAATPAALAATQVKIKSGENELASTTELSPGASTVYLAVPAATGDITGDICITAATADNDYFYMKEGVTLAAKKYYRSTLKMTKGAILSLVTAETYIAKDGETLTGALAADATTKIKIANNATVTLKDVTINGTNVDDIAHKHAGITCDGDATIKLEGTNTVKGFHEKSPGISVPDGNTLTIQGTGSLTASSNGKAAGIGSGYKDFCGAIVIKGGTITATGGNQAAGIGCGYQGTCGAITISGGTVTAMCGDFGAGIGGGDEGTCGTITINGGTVEATGGSGGAGIGGGRKNGTCGTITITSDVTKVKATAGESAPNSIGAGYNGTAITVTIGGVEGAITTSPYEYPPIAATAHELSASVVGDVVGSNGKAYTLDATHVLPSGVTAVAMVAYKSATVNESLAIQLNGSPVSKNWNEANAYTSYPTLPAGTGTWRLPSKEDWQNMFVGCAVSGDASASDNMDPIAGFKAKIAATGITWKSGGYWSSTKSGSKAWDVYVELGFASAYFNKHDASTEQKVLGCLAF